jgi:hypothetical protein
MALNKQTTNDIDRSQEIRAARSKLLRLAREQGVKPLENPETLSSDFWNDADEEREDFDSWLRRLRSEGNGSRL